MRFTELKQIEAIAERRDMPSLTNALRCSALLLVIGPLLGGIMFQVWSVRDPVRSEAGILYIGAYMIGGAPAFAAAVIYCVAACCIVIVARLRQLSWVTASCLGFACGMLGVAAMALFFVHEVLPVVDGLELYVLGALSGAVIAGVSATLLPIGFDRHGIQVAA